MSIHLRLNLAIGTLLFCVLAAMIVAVAFDARPRIAAESESSMRLTQVIVTSSLATLAEAPDPKRALERLVAGLGELRHVRVALLSQAPGTSLTSAAESAWIAPFAPPSAGSLEIPVTIAGRVLDTVVVSPLYADELAEIWDAVQRILEYGVLFSLALVPLTSVLIRRSLSPIAGLAEAMRVLEDGDYGVRVGESGTPELAAICARLNRLASALAASRIENLALSTRMIAIQDEERREIARELHDDLGPHLFALRARASFLARTLAKSTPDLERALQETRDIAGEIDALQRTNRRVLNRLSPAGLKELGLVGAVQGLAQEWRTARPDIQLVLDVPTGGLVLSDSVALTVYRVSQEGLTNAYRHADATAITLSIDEMESEGGRLIRLVVQDNGAGLPPDPSFGHGIRGMRERVSALGGKFSLTPDGGPGTRLEALVPKF